MLNYQNIDWFERPYKAVSDKRLKIINHSESNFPLRHFQTLQEFEDFKRTAKKRMKTSIGLYPAPETCALEVCRFDHRDFAGYSTEKIIFQSLPGFFVTGSLFLPANISHASTGHTNTSHVNTGHTSTSYKVPMILNPHGHWLDGRFERSKITNVPLRCINYALRGMAAFSFDMIGFGDSCQISHEGYSGFEMDLWNESLLGLQIHNCMRALDFVYDLPFVDQSKIGVTGASGGGTQSFCLAALDDRISASMPVNMVSTVFQGSCVCEYAPNLHIGLSNLEIAALMAPRPMMLAGSSGDWTSDLETITYPYLQQIYSLYGFKEHVACFYREGPHGYEKAAQEASYRWFAKQFLNKDLSNSEVQEIDVQFENLDPIRIFGEPEKIKLPALTHEKLFAEQKIRKTEAVERLYNQKDDKNSLYDALAFSVGDISADFSLVEEKKEHSDNLIYKKELLNSSAGAQIPIILLSETSTCEKAIFFAYEDGKKSLVKTLVEHNMFYPFLQAGYTIVCADLFLTGEYNRPFGASGRNFSMPDSLYSYNNYVTAYNYTDDAYRVQDYIGIYKYLHKSFRKIIPAGIGHAAAWVNAALPFLPDAEEAYGDLSVFNGAGDEIYIDKFFLPGFLSCGGFKTCEYLSGISLKPLSSLIHHITNQT